ncbi:MAG: hypothetical protein Pg6A_03750 [Termitinemataceae bacterium]|nr:MAG: hypothetical protein Pg6A_03750 [Termitinemataceae bacterium]
MKKTILKTLKTVFFSAVLLFFGCDNLLQSENHSNTKKENPVSQTVAAIEALDKNAIKSSIANAKEENPEAFASVDDEKLNLLLNNPAEAFRQIALEEKGVEQLKLINVMFNEGSVDDAVKALEAIDPVLADGFWNAVEEIASIMKLSTEEISLSRSAAGDSQRNIRNLPLRMNQMSNSNPIGRKAFSKELEWDAVLWYAGYCVATTLGVYALCSPLPWVFISGIVATAAGSIAMTAQIILWRDTGVIEFAKSLISMDAETATKMVNSDKGLQLITITALTSGTAALCSISPIGKLIVQAVKSLWADVIAVFNSYLPPGLSISINGTFIVDNRPQATPAPPVYIPQLPSRPSPKTWWDHVCDFFGW